MFDLKDLQAARQKITEKRSGNSEEIFNEGLKIMDSYQLNPNVTTLDLAGKKFIEALEYNKDHLPSIIYLSYVFFVLGNEEMALKYIRMAEYIQPELPEEIINYKNEVINKLSDKSKI